MEKDKEAVALFQNKRHEIRCNQVINAVNKEQNLRERELRHETHHFQMKLWKLVQTRKELCLDPIRTRELEVFLNPEINRKINKSPSRFNRANGADKQAVAAKHLLQQSDERPGMVLADTEDPPVNVGHDSGVVDEDVFVTKLPQNSAPQVEMFPKLASGSKGANLSRCPAVKRSSITKATKQSPSSSDELGRNNNDNDHVNGPREDTKLDKLPENISGRSVGLNLVGVEPLKPESMNNSKAKSPLSLPALPGMQKSSTNKMPDEPLLSKTTHTTASADAVSLKHQDDEALRSTGSTAKPLVVRRTMTDTILKKKPDT
eukprot:gene5276-5943_t